MQLQVSAEAGVFGFWVTLNFSWKDVFTGLFLYWLLRVVGVSYFWGAGQSAYRAAAWRYPEVLGAPDTTIPHHLYPYAAGAGI